MTFKQFAVRVFPWMIFLAVTSFFGGWNAHAGHVMPLIHDSMQALVDCRQRLEMQPHPGRLMIAVHQRDDLIRLLKSSAEATP